MSEKSPDEFVVEHYRQYISRLYPNQLIIWPLISGYNCRIGGYKNWLVIIFSHTGNSEFRTTNGLGELSEMLIGAASIDDANKAAIRDRLARHFILQPHDGVVFLDRTGSNLELELHELASRHAFALGLTPMKIFLSHKGFDKPLVREFRDVLATLGFDPWLDEDNMPAGTSLERGLLQGFAESCAAVFFITPNFKDESFLATEVDYAIKEKRAKGDRFSIITLIFGDGTAKGSVPDLLRTYVWKEPKSHLEAIKEIIRALPIRVGDIRWR